MTPPDIITRYAAAISELTPDNMEMLIATVSADVRFVDPFNDVTGRDGFRAMFEHMFETCDEPRFQILDIATSTDQGEQRAYLRWRMSGRFRSWPHTDLGLEGMSEIHVDKDGLVCLHLDHWDSASQLLARLPVIGTIIRPVLKKFRIKPAGR